MRAIKCNEILVALCGCVDVYVANFQSRNGETHLHVDKIHVEFQLLLHMEIVFHANGTLRWAKERLLNGITFQTAKWSRAVERNAKVFAWNTANNNKTA